MEGADGDYDCVSWEEFLAAYEDGGGDFSDGEGAEG